MRGSELRRLRREKGLTIYDVAAVSVTTAPPRDCFLHFVIFCNTERCYHGENNHPGALRWHKRDTATSGRSLRMP
jgi:hypothetical protein